MRVYHFPKTIFGEMYYYPEEREAVVYHDRFGVIIYTDIRNIDFRNIFEYEEIEDDFYSRKKDAIDKIREARRRFIKAILEDGVSMN